MLSWQEVLLRLALAGVFGALIGLERERKNWSAGMRTHMMVCVGSCLIMIVSAYGFFSVLKNHNIVLDPSRIAAQVVSGIGFIGAGTILFQKEGTIRGLTTAAGLWTVAAIGLATGGGMYLAAMMTTIIALIILWALQPIEKRYARRFVKQTLRIVTLPDLEEADIINDVLQTNSFVVKNFNLSKLPEEYIFTISFESADQKKLAKFLHTLRKQKAVKQVSWEN